MREGTEETQENSILDIIVACACVASQRPRKNETTALATHRPDRKEWKYCWKLCLLYCPLRGCMTRPVELSSGCAVQCGEVKRLLVS
jgi:hypothetical protein